MALQVFVNYFEKIGKKQESIVSLRPNTFVKFMLSARNIVKKYNRLEVLKGVNVQIEQGEIVSIVGSSGAGKSTLLHILGTLDEADGGEIMLNNQPIHQLKGKKLADFRNNHIGFVFQFHHLLPEFTALENVCVPGWIAQRGKKELQLHATELLSLLGLADRIHNKPQELSGGEQQRVAVARALINRPDIIFADEPTGNLDSANAKDLHDLFLRLQQELGHTFLIVTHNEELAALSNRVLHMKDGLIVS
ncbi:ABC transporter ATP-binding protein [Hydrotalea sp.]|uniref:ABC transporter ATP-binding protein n=1 Tax=Hydrotalea sp. TaxID=2881279 RepID=UPI00338F6223